MICCNCRYVVDILLMFDKSSISGTFFLPLASPDLTCADKCKNQDSPGRSGWIVTGCYWQLSRNWNTIESCVIEKGYGRIRSLLFFSPSVYPAR